MRLGLTSFGLLVAVGIFVIAAIASGVAGFFAPAALDTVAAIAFLMAWRNR
jgi:uncharacterized membrane protein (DUF485 family)